MYTVASPDPSPRDGGQLPIPNKCNSTLTSGTRGEIPNPNGWNKWEGSPHLFISPGTLKIFKFREDKAIMYFANS